VVIGRSFLLVIGSARRQRALRRSGGYAVASVGAAFECLEVERCALAETFGQRDRPADLVAEVSGATGKLGLLIRP
jgi:hypothetical protein